MFSRQWEDEVAWFPPEGGKLHPTLSERTAGARESCLENITSKLNIFLSPGHL